MQKLSRRQILKAISALPAVSPATSVLAQAANPQPQEWTGFAICDSCNHVPSCGIQFQAQGNNIISIQNWKENPRHWLCSKGMSTLQRLYNPNRLLYPMKRTAPKGAEDPGWVRITWDEAYKTIAVNMLAAKKKYGPESVMFYAGDPKEPRPSIYRLARYFDSPTWATESSAACRSGCMMAEQLNFGQPNNGSTPTKDTKVYMIMATNVWAQPLGWWEAIKAAKARGCKIITVDTRRTKAAEIADIHLAPAIGTDAALAAGIARVLIKENLINRPFIDQWTHGFEEYAKYVDQFTPEKTQEITGCTCRQSCRSRSPLGSGSGLLHSDDSVSVSQLQRREQHSRSAPAANPDGLHRHPRRRSLRSASQRLVHGRLRSASCYGRQEMVELP